MFATAGHVGGSGTIRGYGNASGDFRPGVNPYLHPTAGGDYRSHVHGGTFTPVMTWNQSTERGPAPGFVRNHNALRTQGSNNEVPGAPFSTTVGTTIVDVVMKAGVRGADGLIGRIFQFVPVDNTNPFHKVVVRKRQFNVTPALEQPDMGTATTFDDSEDIRAFTTTRVAKAKQIGVYWSMEPGSAEWMTEFANQMLSSFELTLISMCYSALLAVYTPEKCIEEHSISYDPNMPMISGDDFARIRLEEANLFAIINKDPATAAGRMIDYSKKAMSKGTHEVTDLMMGECVRHVDMGLLPPPVSEVGEKRADMIRRGESVITNDIIGRKVRQIFVPRNYIGSNRRAYDALLKRVAFGKFVTTPDWSTIGRAPAAYQTGGADPTIIDYDANAFVTLAHAATIAKSGLADANSGLAQILIDSVEMPAARRGQPGAPRTIGDWYAQPDMPAFLRPLFVAALARGNGVPVVNGTQLALTSPVADLFAQNVIDWFIADNVPYPVSFVCGRFGISVDTENVLAIDASQPIGVVAASGIDTFVSDSIQQHRTQLCVGYFGANVVTPEAIAMIPSAFLRSYNGGGNTDMFDNSGVAPVARDVDGDDVAIYDQNMIVIPVTFKQLRLIKTKRVFSLAVPGFDISAPMLEQTVTPTANSTRRPGYMPSDAMCHFFINRYFSQARYDQGDVHIVGGLGKDRYLTNLTCTQGYQLAPSIATVNAHISERMTVCTHFGDCPYANVFERLLRQEPIK